MPKVQAEDLTELNVGQVVWGRTHPSIAARCSLLEQSMRRSICPVALDLLLDGIAARLAAKASRASVVATRGPPHDQPTADVPGRRRPLRCLQLIDQQRHRHPRKLFGPQIDGRDRRFG